MMKAQIFNFRLWIDEYNPEVLKRKLNDLLVTSNFTIVGFTEHFFEPYGYSAVWLLGESHLALHTFPEHNVAYLELSSCVDRPFNKFKRQIAGAFANYGHGDEPKKNVVMSGRKRR